MLITFFSDNLREYPLVRGETDAFRIVKKNKRFIWKVYSTIGYAKYRSKSTDWTWDHLSFAFYFPDRVQRFYVSPKLCNIETKDATDYYPYSRSDYNMKKGRETEACPALVYKLKDKITQGW